MNLISSTFNDEDAAEGNGNTDRDLQMQKLTDSILSWQRLNLPVLAPAFDAITNSNKALAVMTDEILASVAPPYDILSSTFSCFAKNVAEAQSFNAASANASMFNSYKVLNVDLVNPIKSILEGATFNINPFTNIGLNSGLQALITDNVEKAAFNISSSSNAGLNIGRGVNDIFKSAAFNVSSFSSFRVNQPDFSGLGATAISSEVLASVTSTFSLSPSVAFSSILSTSAINIDYIRTARATNECCSCVHHRHISYTIIIEGNVIVNGSSFAIGENIHQVTSSNSTDQ